MNYNVHPTITGCLVFNGGVAQMQVNRSASTFQRYVMSSCSGCLNLVQLNEVNGRSKCITERGCKEYGQSSVDKGAIPSEPLATVIQIPEIRGDNIHMLTCRFSFSEMITLSSNIPD
jgi:hypothetical protein